MSVGSDALPIAKESHVSQAMFTMLLHDVQAAVELIFAFPNCLAICRPTSLTRSLIAQLVEQSTVNRSVAGSSPAQGATHFQNSPKISAIRELCFSGPFAVCHRLAIDTAKRIGVQKADSFYSAKAMPARTWPMAWSMSSMARTR